jgi:fatty acid desaturase
MNYHTEHHMYAAVPCYNLKKLHRLIKADLPECPHGLVATWRQILEILKKQRQDPKYQYVPVLPAPKSTTKVRSETLREEAMAPPVAPAAN